MTDLATEVGLGEPPMTRFLAQQLSASHSYDFSALERELGYRERVQTREATERRGRVPARRLRAARSCQALERPDEEPAARIASPFSVS